MHADALPEKTMGNVMQQALSGQLCTCHHTLQHCVLMLVLIAQCWCC